MTLAQGIAVLRNGMAYFFSDKIALAASGAQPVTREQAPRLYEVMERLCGKANLPMPKLYVIPQAAPNAFATGRNPVHASVAVTAGPLGWVNNPKIRSGSAPEMSHLRHYYILPTPLGAPPP